MAWRRPWVRPPSAPQMRDTSRSGYVAETKVLTELIKRGFTVSIPFGDCRYDLVAERGGRFFRIQVKYINWLTKHNTIRLNLHSITRNGRRRYRADEVDFFVAYYEPEEKFYVVPFQDVKGRIAIQLRRTPPINNQKKKVIFATQYENRWDLLLGFYRSGTFTQ